MGMCSRHGEMLATAATFSGFICIFILVSSLAALYVLKRGRGKRSRYGLGEYGEHPRTPKVNRRPDTSGPDNVKGADGPQLVSTPHQPRHRKYTDADSAEPAGVMALLSGPATHAPRTSGFGLSFLNLTFNVIFYALLLYTVWSPSPLGSGSHVCFFRRSSSIFQ